MLRRIIAVALFVSFIAIFGGVMVCLLVVLYGVALNNEVPAVIAIPMDKLAAEAEAYE